MKIKGTGALFTQNKPEFVAILASMASAAEGLFRTLENVAGDYHNLLWAFFSAAGLVVAWLMHRQRMRQQERDRRQRWILEGKDE